jgi:GT2 family glycosyltransferase
VLLARNAADYDFYRSRCNPNNLLADIKHPIAGYYGAIATWFDVDLLVEVAQRKPDFTFVLLGGVFDVDVSRLRLLPNVVLLGQQPYETMPQYLYHFDVCIIPFKINQVTEATDPVKLYEYLSGGKPVVSVSLPELEPYRGYVYLAEDAADFSAKIDLALAEDSPRLIEDRKALARRHTWSDRYQSIRSNFKDTVPRASIIIVTYNNLALTKLCLESIFRNTDYPNYEIIIVDNNSADGTPQFLQELNEKHDNLAIILNSVNNGFAKANNQGIELSQGEYLVLLNNDTVVPQGWLSRLLKHLSDPEVGLAGPVTNFVGNEAKIDVSYRTWAEMEVFAQDFTWRHQQQVAEIHMLAMFCIAMRREVYEKVGPLDEQFGIGMFEDDDYSMRMKQLGYRLICVADAFVHHFGQAAFGKLIRSGSYDQLFDENRQKYEKKWGVEWQPHQHSPLDFEAHPIPVMADGRDRRNERSTVPAK